MAIVFSLAGRKTQRSKSGPGRPARPLRGGVATVVSAPPPAAGRTGKPAIADSPRLREPPAKVANGAMAAVPTAAKGVAAEPQPPSKPADSPASSPAGVHEAGIQVGNGAAVAAVNGNRSRESHAEARMQESVDLLIRNYRVRGHLIAKVDPLGIPRPMPPELEPKFWGLSEADLDRPFSTYCLAGSNSQTLRDIMDRLRSTYCGAISVQFMHVDDLEVREWLQQRMEEPQNRLKLSRDEQIRILTRLTDAVIFEEFIRRKFVGAKSFSLEGAESLIPLLDLAIEKASSQGIESIVMAMAHRGRLNVLANIIGKCPQDIFREFEDIDPELYRGGGDVKYHLGYYNDFVTSTGRKVHLSLCFNPSHLEFVNPVALGLTRAKQDRGPDLSHERNLAILIHGDAAFIGEGIVQETLNLSQLPGYSVGGTVHVVINNQIGFTTPPEQTRSTVYATDVAKMLQIPIFHVNGEQPEAVAQVISLAMDFRATFHRDVVIDMYCYRRWGHNEGDEPAFTQPLLYRWIENHKSVREAYLEHLLAMGEVTQTEADADRRAPPRKPGKRPLFGPPRGLRAAAQGVGRRVEGLLRRARAVGRRRRDRRTPAAIDFPSAPPHRAARRLPPPPQIEADDREPSADGGGAQPLDWSAAEALAYATLSMDGYRVRLSGQDSIRGTFSHRHAAYYDTEDGRSYFPLKNLRPSRCRSRLSTALCRRRACWVRVRL